MKKLLRNLFSSLPLGPRLFLLVFALGFPVAWMGAQFNLFDLYGWLALAPALVWKGQIWRLVSYAFLPAGPLDWIISLFWLATLVLVLGRIWSGTGFWAYCLLGALGGGLFAALLRPGMQIGVVGSAAIIFALLVAWDYFYRNERLILLGIGEISVRQAAILIAIINSLILFFCSWFLMLAMWCGGVAGWLWLIIRAKLFLGKTPQQIRSERVARLEL
jgi:membrane associated rhomboid family serine protease